MAECKRGRCTNTARYGYRGFCETHHKAHLREIGITRGFVDAAPVQAHIKLLQKYGIGAPQIEKLTGIPHLTVDRIRTGQKRVLRRIAVPILAIGITEAADGASVPSIGTTRRLQALVALGYSIREIAKESGRSECAVSRACGARTPVVTAAFARDIIDVFNNLHMVIPPDSEGSRKARNRARKLHWRLPLEWDEDEIDDPDIGPAITREVKRADRAEQYHASKVRGLTDSQIAAELGIHPSSLSQWLFRQRKKEAECKIAA